jgi:hypothetical protein
VAGRIKSIERIHLIGTQGTYFVVRACSVCGIRVYSLWGVLRIPDKFHIAGFMLICDLVVCVYHALPILLSDVEVLFCGSLRLKLLFTVA